MVLVVQACSLIIPFQKTKVEHVCTFCLIVSWYIIWCNCFFFNMGAIYTEHYPVFLSPRCIFFFLYIIFYNFTIYRILLRICKTMKMWRDRTFLQFKNFVNCIIFLLNPSTAVRIIKAQLWVSKRISHGFLPYWGKLLMTYENDPICRQSIEKGIWVSSNSNSMMFF